MSSKSHHVRTRVGGVIKRGGSQSSGRRVNRKRSSPLQAEGSAGRYHQGYQETFLLLETRRQEKSEAGACAETEFGRKKRRHAVKRLKAIVFIVIIFMYELIFIAQR